MSFSGSGQATLPLECSVEKGRTACQIAAATVEGQLTAATDLMPYSIEDPLPTADGCTASSVVAPSWTISNFAIDRYTGTGADTRPNANESASSIAFNIKLNVKATPNDYPFYVSHKDVRLDGAGAGVASEWYPCAFGAGEVPLAPKNCTFQYREETNTLAVNADWVCIDLDVENPYVLLTS